MPTERNSLVASPKETPAPDHVRRTIVLPASPGEVWASLTEPDRLGAWFGADVDMEVRRHGRATFRWPGDVERGAVVEDVEPGRFLGFRWLPFVRIDGRAQPVAPGRVELTLEPDPDGTRLTVVEWTSWPRSSVGGP